MEFRFLVFDEDSVIASFKYFDDAVAFVNTLIPDLDFELFGYDIFDMNRAETIEFKKIKAIIKAGCVAV